eukprot:jgi/Bigna1/127577/aug1.4_g2285
MHRGEFDLQNRKILFISKMAALETVVDAPNKEGEDLKVSLSEKTKEDLKDVVLHGLVVSPPSVKIRTILHYYGVQWTNKLGPKKGSEYRKVPVMIINGRQINDSHIMVKNLAPILDGKGLTDEMLEVEKLVTDGIQLSLSKSENKVYSKRLKDALGEKPFFHGEKPGIIDIAVWSILNLHVKAGTHAIQDMFDDGNGWSDYYFRMKKQGNLASFDVRKSFK